MELKVCSWVQSGTGCEGTSEIEGVFVSSEWHRE